MKTSNPAVPPTASQKEEPKKKDYLLEDEREHLNFLRRRMENSRDERDAPREEWDGMSYVEAYDRDTASALSSMAPTKNKGEPKVSTGTTRQALISLVSRALSYSYHTELNPFDKQDRILSELGRALEISVDHANYLDSDLDKAKLRANELFTHGDVIVFDDWVIRWGKEKSRPKFDGKVKGVKWTERKKKIFEGCERRVVSGKRFYFGTVFEDDDRRQPFMFEDNRISYSDAKEKYGDWERFPHVLPGGKMTPELESSGQYESWALEKAESEDLEEIIYVDVPNNEMQVILGGVPMLPSGFPMKWGHGEYPWAHQGAEPIRTGFAYHRSFVRTLLNMQDIESDLYRALIILAWKAAMPPVANQTGRVLTRRNLMAGEILDVDPDRIKPIFDGSLGHTGFIENVLSRINTSMTTRSVPEIKQGIGSAGTATATETLQVQKEAEVALSLNLSAVAGIQSKIDRLRAMNIMDFCFRNGKGMSIGARGGEGVRHIIEAVDAFTDKNELRDKELAMSKAEGEEVRITQVRKDAFDFVDRLEAVAVSKPKRSSFLERQEMMQMFQSAAAIFGQRLDTGFLEDMFRSAYRIPANVVLSKDVDLSQLPGLAPQAKRQPEPLGAGLENMAPTA